MRKSAHNHSWLMNEWGISCDACLKQFITSHRSQQNTTPIFLPEEPHGQKSLVGYSPCGHKELDMTEQLSTHHSGAFLCVRLCAGY